jgi:hypothetical protein
MKQATKKSKPTTKPVRLPESELIQVTGGLGRNLA